MTVTPSACAAEARGGSDVASGSPRAVCGCQGDTVRHRQGAGLAIVVPGVELAGRGASVGVNNGDLEPTALEQDERVHRVGVRPAIDPGHHVDDLGEVECADAGRPRWVAQLAFDVSCGRLVEEERDDRLGVEDGQRGAPGRLWASASSSRVRRRTSSELTVLASSPRRAPLAAPMGSIGSGRKTSSSPRSSTSTRFVPHRWRISAGIETWPPFEMDACFMSASLTHEGQLST